MVVKKQLRKISKKIMILGLATSIIFTSCFSTKKIEAHAASVAAGLGAYTLYEICLYFGGLAVTALGIGAVYENRDEIALLGKSIIDNITSLPEQGWLFGSTYEESNYVYGSEALQEVKDTSWTVIQGGGNSPKNDNDNDGDGDKDSDDRTVELNLTGFFLLEAGRQVFNDTIKPLYDKWIHKEPDNPLDYIYGLSDEYYFDGTFLKNDDGKYVARLYRSGYIFDLVGPSPFYATLYDGDIYIKSAQKFSVLLDGSVISSNRGNFLPSSAGSSFSFLDGLPVVYSFTGPIFGSYDDGENFRNNGIINNVLNYQKSYPVADWLADEEYWKGLLEDLSSSLRSLQGLTNIAQEFAENLLEYKPTVNIAGDTLNDLALNYAPITNVYITQPIYYPAANTTPKLDISVFPNYDIYIENGGGADTPDTPDDGGFDDEIPEIDLDGLLSIFNILFYLIMILVMLIYLFLSCLAFIVMIFRIPASSTMLPDEMVMGFDHLKTIMIPGMNISIYGFAMALIYMFIIFAVIKLIRLEINDFKFPRSYK